MFHEALGLTGLVLTKLDGTAKGGIVVRDLPRARRADQAGRRRASSSRTCSPSIPKAFVDALIVSE